MIHICWQLCNCNFKL